jgi:N-acetyl-alpha-D-glucosaminyl L-malate synthase BshA
MAEVALAYDLDLLHVHYAIPHSVSAFLAQNIVTGRRLPFVTTLHGTDITLVGVDRSYFPITKFSIERSDGVTAVSDYLSQQTREVFGVTREIQVIPNFVNCDTYLPSAGRKGDRHRLIHISNFRPVKRVPDCIRILKEVRRSVSAELWMVGDGPERGPAEMLARELGVAAHVHFWGKQAHVEKLIPQADVLLMPSETEAFGLVALEAMACGVPTVATKVGGVSELISDGEDGFLAPMGDVAAQAASVVRLLTDEALYERVATAARRKAETHFTTETIIPMYERCYESALQGN